MAKKLFGFIQILLLIGSLSFSSLAVDGETFEPQAKSAAVETKTVNLFGPDMDEDEDLIPMAMAGAEGMNPISSSAQPGHESGMGPEIWQEPNHKMNLIRFFNGRYYESQYNKINELLVRDVDSNNVEANMAYLSAWLERETQKGVRFLNKATVEALRQLIDLYNLKGQKRCDRDAYSIMFINNQATGGRAHKSPTKLAPPRRVDVLVYRLFLDHAIECFNVYPENYAKARETVDQESKRLVESFLDSIIADPLAITTKVTGVANKAIVSTVYNFLRVNSLSDPLSRYLVKVVDERNGKMIVNNDKVRELVNKYIVQPCQVYRQGFGPDVFLPARFDAKMLLRDDRYKSESRLLNEFMHSYLHFNLCEKIIKSDEPHLTKNLSKYIQSNF